MGKARTIRMQHWRRKMWRAQQGLCHWCRHPMAKDGGPTADDFPTFEHLIPRSHGGLTCPANLVLVHRLCNQERGAPEPILNTETEAPPTALYEAFKRAGLVSA